MLAYAVRIDMPGERHVRIFRNGRNQAIRIPREFELPREEAIMRKGWQSARDRASAATQLALGVCGNDRTRGIPGNRRQASGTGRSLMSQ